MSKGSSPRPYSVDLKTFDKNWDAIFKKPDPRVIEDAKLEDEAFKRIEEENKQKNNIAINNPESLLVTANPVPDCTCGRSPFKHCSGLHSLSEEEAKRQLDIYHENLIRDRETYYSNNDQQT